MKARAKVRMQGQEAYKSIDAPDNVAYIEIEHANVKLRLHPTVDGSIEVESDHDIAIVPGERLRGFYIQRA